MNLRDDAKAFVDGELDPLRAEAVIKAMETDPDLREEIEAMRALGFELKRVAVDHPAKGVDGAMDKFRRPRMQFRRYLPIAAFGVLMICVLTLTAVNSSSKSAQGFAMAADTEVGQPNMSLTTGTTGTTGSTGTTGTTGTAGESLDYPDVNGDVSGTISGRQFGDSGVGGGKSLGGGPQLGGEGVATIRGGLRKEAGFGGRQRSTRGADKTRTFTYNSNDSTVATPSPNSGLDKAALHPDLVRTASLALKVQSAQGAMEEAMGLAKRMGGFYESSHHAKGTDHNAIADVTLRVPVTRFDLTLTSLRKLGEVIEDTSESEDVTAQIADTGARLKVMRAEEESYVTMLRAGRRVGEILEIKDRLSTVRQQIESLTAQQKALKNQSSYSTIACTFAERPQIKEPAPPVGWTNDAWANAVNGLQGVGRFLGQALIFLFVYSPVWLPILIVGWVFARKNRRSA